MVEKLDNQDNADTVWVVRPTRSLTWPEAKRWLCVISIIPLLTGLLFMGSGIHRVSCFTTASATLLWAAFYYVHWTGEMCEVIRLTPQRVILERGRRVPDQRFEYERAWVKVDLDENRGWLPSSLRIRSHGRAASVGEFLTDGERRALALALINALGKSR